MLDNTFLMRYTDLATCIRAKTLEEIQMKLNQVMRRVLEWMEGHALYKTEISTKSQLIELNKLYKMTLNTKFIKSVVFKKLLSQFLKMFCKST